ncbi:MAG: hypothetical protein AB7G28_19595 [Pirellulales bacterium]
MRMIRFGRLATTVLAAAVAGCNNRPARVGVPDFDAVEISAQALTTYDINHDGRLDSAECSKSLASTIGRADKDHDGQLTADEIAGRFKFYEEFRAGIVPVFCTISRGGRPVADATVTYQPEDFMGPNAVPATGKTNAAGSTPISMSADHLPSPAHAGVQPGFYRVLVTLADGTSVSKLDAGVECAGDVQNTHSFVLP